MENKQGFYTVEPLNNELTRVALVWNNTVNNKYGNETVSKEIIDVERLPSFLAHMITRNDIENIANELKNKNNIKECAIVFDCIA